MTKSYSTKVDLDITVPDETDYQELLNDLNQALIDVIESHKGTMGGTFKLIRTIRD